jgi:hypothetical protein
LALSPLLPLLLALAACAPDDPAAEGDGAVDMIRDFPEAPEGGLRLMTPEFTVGAYSDVQTCFVDTYTGPTIGIHAQWTYQSPGGHHVVLTATTATEREIADGTVYDCTDGTQMTNLDPLFIGGILGTDENDHVGEMILPDGMAAQMEEGTRIIIQSHYINTTDDDILVQDAIDMELTDPDAVETWVAPFVHVQTHHPIPTGEYDLQFDCAWEDPYNVLFLGGHMHEWGQSFYTDMTRAGASSPERIYEIQEWDPYMRDAPVYIDYQKGEFTVAPGDSFRTSCTWNNTTDATLDFPEEMCVTFGMVYPAKVPVVCSP